MNQKHIRKIENGKIENQKTENRKIKKLKIEKNGNIFREVEQSINWKFEQSKFENSVNSN